MKTMIFIKASLLVVVSMAGMLVSTSATFGQAGKVDTKAPPPKPLPAPQKLDLGKIEGSTYSNEQLGFYFTAPATWTVLDENAMTASREYARKVFEDEKDPKIKANLEASVERTTTLFSASKLAVGATTGLNAVLICAAERIPTAVVTTPREYFNLMLQSLNRTDGVKVEVIEPFQVKRIGTTDFGSYTIKVTVNVGTYIQKQLMAVRASYAYGLIFSYVDNEDVIIFDEVVRTVKSR